MGKQKKQRRQMAKEELARRTQKQTRWRGNQQELEEALEDGTVVLEVRPQAPPREEKPKVSGLRAGKREYGEFFGVYATYVRNPRKTALWQGRARKRPGTAFVPLGFIPGPAILLVFSDRDSKVQITEATSDIREELEVPTPWMEMEELPLSIYQAAVEWDAIWEHLRYEHSAWNAGLAQRLLGGRFVPDYLAMGMPMFRYQTGDQEKPFGVLLVATEHEAEMEVLRVYNPQGIPNVPAEGTILTLTELKDGRGPVQKILRTWALMEANYAARYDHRGQRLSRPRPEQYPPSFRH